jgi:protein-S-isoprenylcysteine O-methyltransferase Ste14
MVTTILAYVLLAVFFGVVDRQLRVGQAAKSLDQTPSDAGSTHLIGYAYFITGFALLGAPFLDYFQIAALPSGGLLGWSGIGVALLGVALRAWAFRTLGEYHTRTLKVSPDQRIIRQGPYRLVRHPGYLASIMIWLGAALATTNGIPIFIASVVLALAYHYRIQAEERMLMNMLPVEYAEYRAHTWKLVPFLY